MTISKAPISGVASRGVPLISVLIQGRTRPAFRTGDVLIGIRFVDEEYKGSALMELRSLAVLVCQVAKLRVLVTVLLTHCLKRLLVNWFKKKYRLLLAMVLATTLCPK